MSHISFISKPSLFCFASIHICCLFCFFNLLPFGQCSRVHTFYRGSKKLTDCDIKKAWIVVHTNLPAATNKSFPFFHRNLSRFNNDYSILILNFLPLMLLNWHIYNSIVVISYLSRHILLYLYTFRNWNPQIQILALTALIRYQKVVFSLILPFLEALLKKLYYLTHSQRKIANLSYH